MSETGGPSHPAEMSDAAPPPAVFSWQQVVALVVGAFYVVFGIAGFFFVQDLGDDVTGQAQDSLLGIDLNGAQNAVHVVLGVVGLLMASRARSARRYGVLLAVVGAILFVLGLVGAGQPDLNVLDLNWGANILHLVTALVGLATAVVKVRSADGAPE